MMLFLCCDGHEPPMCPSWRSALMPRQRSTLACMRAPISVSSDSLRAALSRSAAPGCAPSSITCSLDVSAPPANVFCAKLITVLPPSAPGACRQRPSKAHASRHCRACLMVAPQNTRAWKVLTPTFAPGSIPTTPSAQALGAPSAWQTPPHAPPAPGCASGPPSTAA